MKPAKFEYRQAQTADQALAWLAQFGDEARILAGGQSLMVLPNMRLAQVRCLIDISACAELNYIREENGEVCVGASTTQAQLQAWPGLSARLPLLAEALPFMSHFQIRNRGTVVGSVAHADPSAEIPLCLAVLGGQVSLHSKAQGQRALKAGDFQQGMLSTARQADELLHDVRFPAALPDHGYAFDEFGIRRGDFAIVAVAAVAGPAGIRLGVGGVADQPMVADWPQMEPAALADALNDFAWQLDARGDSHASAAHRRHLVRVLGQRAVEKAMQRQSAPRSAHE